MMTRLRSLLSYFSCTLAVFLAITFLSAAPIHSQSQTVGLFLNDTASFAGYNLYMSGATSTAYLIDHYGRYVNSWILPSRPGGSTYLLENGLLLWAGRPSSVENQGGHLIESDWDGTVVWEWKDSSPSHLQHHDVEPLPNGNVLILARDFIPGSEVLAAGRDSNSMSFDTMWSEMVIEVEPTGPTTGNVVWEWRVWDHLIQDYDSTKANFGIVENHPELMDLNFSNGLADWLHANALEYNPQLDQIIISYRTISEFWVIDHSTTTAEAASHTGGNSGMGGDIIYRWGNPAVYRAGDSTDQKLFFQHDAQWIDSGLPGEGHILVFNNGNARNYSSVDEIVSTADINGNYPVPDSGTSHGPSDPVWTYVDNPPDSFFAWFISGTQRLPSGNTFICNGPAGEFREVTPAGEIVWRYVNPVGSTGPVAQGQNPVNNRVFRCTRIGPDYPGLEGKDLTPAAAIEIYPITISGTSHWPEFPTPLDSSLIVTASINAPGGVLTAEVMFDTGSGEFAMELFDDGAHSDGSAGDGLYGAAVATPSTDMLVKYYVRVEDNILAVVSDPPNPPQTVYYLPVGFTCGNVDGLTPAGGAVNIIDLVYIVDYIFRGGPIPPDQDAANVDGITTLIGVKVDILDLVYMVDFFFRSGPPPICE